MRIRVDYEETCTHSHRENKKYGDWEERHESSVTAAYRIADDENVPYGSESFLISDDAEYVYVIYMIYDTGDSFGRSYGKIDILHATASEANADALAKQVSENPSEYTIKFNDDFERDISIYNSGSGYFERIQYVGVESFAIGNGLVKKRYYVN